MLKFKIEAKFTKEDIERDLKEWAHRVYKITLAEYKRIARQCVTEARNKSKATGGFDDQTGNLRASMGYVIFYNGQQVDINFEGVSAGKNVGGGFAKKVAADYPKGWAIVIVAGMEYASFVEALNYDVITGSTLGMAAKFESAHKRIEAALKSNRAVSNS